jgi:hypothetical protein
MIRMFCYDMLTHERLCVMELGHTMAVITSWVCVVELGYTMGLRHGFRTHHGCASCSYIMGVRYGVGVHRGCASWS